MNLLLRAAAAAALLLPLAVAPATAQNYRGAFGIYGGGLWSSDFNNNGDNGFNGFPGVVVTNGDLVEINGTFFSNRDLRLEPGWIAGAQGEYWFGRGRFGARINGAYTERPFELRDGGFFFQDTLVIDEDGDVVIDDISVDDESAVFGDVNTWFGDADLLIRILTPRAERNFAPFVSLGLGFVNYNPAGGDTDVIIPEANVFFEDDQTKFAGAFGLGADVLPGWTTGRIGWGLRFEVADHIAFESPASRLLDGRLVIDTVDTDTVIAISPEDDENGDEFDAVHHVRFTAGLHALFGRLFAPPVAILPPPAPPAPPAPEEERVMVCVVDPTMPGGISMVSALYVPSTRDTLVTVDGQRVRLETAVKAVMTAPQADWFIRGQPMAVTVGAEQAEFVTYGGTRIIEPDQVAFIGMVNGLGVYADKLEVQNTPLANVQPGADLRALLAQSAEARQAFQEIEVLYVPTQAVGCVFQPLRRVEEVRKVRG